jgi:hypothetical protein
MSVYKPNSCRICSAILFCLRLYYSGKKNTTTEWDDGEKGNKNKLILTEIYPSIHET